MYFINYDSLFNDTIINEGDLHMIPEYIQNIILRYDKEVCNEISAINLAIERIKDSLKVINEVISSDLFSYMKSDKIFDKEKENQLLQDAQTLREFISSIDNVHESKVVKKSQMITFHKNLSIQDIIVLKTTQKCKHESHEMQDVIAKIPVLYDTCDVQCLDVQLAYCKTCGKYYMLKSDFDMISGIILCQVVDQTTNSTNNQDDNFIALQKQSVLYRCGYTVSSQRKLSAEARRIILCSVIESRLMTKFEIKDHLNMLIERGSKIPSWENAVVKWKFDKKFINDYQQENVPQIVYEKIVLKYTK